MPCFSAILQSYELSGIIKITDISTFLRIVSPRSLAYNLKKKIKNEVRNSKNRMSVARITASLLVCSVNRGAPAKVWGAGR